MKRFVLILLALLTVASLCACGTKNNGDFITADGQKAAGREAGNAAVDYSFAYPEEWTIARNDGVVEIQTDCNLSDAVAEYATVTVLAFTLPDGVETAKQYWETQEQDTASVMTEYKLLDTKEYTEADQYLDDTPAMKVKYSGKMNGRTYISDQIICCRYGEVYLITLVVPEEYYESVSSVVSVVKDSFKFC